MERDQRGLAVSDLQKINKELEKLQVSDDDSVFSDSPGSVSGTAPENGFGTRAEGYQLAEERHVRERHHSGHRDARAQSPALSLRSSAPSPHHRAKVRPGGHVLHCPETGGLSFQNSNKHFNIHRQTCGAHILTQ